MSARARARVVEVTASRLHEGEDSQQSAAPNFTPLLHERRASLMQLNGHSTEINCLIQNVKQYYYRNNFAYSVHAEEHKRVQRR